MDTELKSSFLPECWKDDVRMNSLFLEFRNKDVNPTAWLSKMNFWIDAISRYCECENQIIFDVDDLKSAFKRNNRVPATLNNVLSEMRKQKTVITYQEFTARSSKQGWMSWGYEMTVKKPLSMGWNLLSSYVVKKPGNENQQLVHLSVLKEKSNLAYQTLKAQGKNIYAFDEVVEICHKNKISTKSLNVILIHLEVKGLVSLVTLDEAKYVKITSESKTTEKHEDDLSLVRMNNIQSKLEEEIDRLKELIQIHLKEAKAQLNKGCRNLAKNSLRRKKRFEDILAKKEIALENIQVLMNNIEEAESNRMIAEAYKAGVDAYKRKVETNGLDVDNLEDLMVSINEVLETDQEMRDLISTPTDSTFDVSLDELERELADIVSSGDKDQEINLNPGTASPKLPEVSTNPITDDLETRFARLRQSPISDPKTSKKKVQMQISS